MVLSVLLEGAENVWYLDVAGDEICRLQWVLHSKTHVIDPHYGNENPKFSKFDAIRPSVNGIKVIDYQLGSRTAELVLAYRSLSFN